MKHSIAGITSKFQTVKPQHMALMAAPAATGDFIINPWLGIIGLCVLIVTGAIAVIREIQIEDRENKS